MDDKAHIRAELDLAEARWTSAGPEAEFALVAHTDGVTYTVLRQPGGDTELVFTPAEWDAFRRGVQDGEFDRSGGAP